jgi:hypothetical protein
MPLVKTIAQVKNTPAVPLVWRSERKGMQGGEPLDADAAALAREAWLELRNHAVYTATLLAKYGVHKSIANRVLEPFMSHTVIITATTFEGFFAQRCTPADGSQPLAQDEIVYPADLMRAAYAASTPAPVDYDQWHLPFLSAQTRAELTEDQQLMCSAARCARVSYLNHMGVPNIESDLQLYHRLVNARPPHASPLEHVATPAKPGATVLGNFTGWHQLRHQVLPEGR